MPNPHTLADSIQKSLRLAVSADCRKQRKESEGTKTAPVVIESPAAQVDATTYQAKKQFSPGLLQTKHPPSHTLCQLPPLSETPICEFFKESHNPAPALAAALLSVTREVPKWAECMTRDIRDPALRVNCDKAYILACFLLIHKAISLANFDQAYLHHKQSATNTNIVQLFPCNVLEQLWQLILHPVFNAAPSLHDATEYLRHIADQCCLTQLSTVYDMAFFTASHLQKLFRITNWDMSEHFCPATTPASAWSVYYFLACLATKSHHSAILPPQGLSLSAAKYLIQFNYILFRSMDSRLCREATPFEASMLGLHLWCLRDLLHDPAMDHIWPQDPKSLTYHFCDSIRDLLYPFQSLAYYASSWAPEYSFDSASTQQLAILPHTDDRIPFYQQLIRQVNNNNYSVKWNLNKLRSLTHFQHQVPVDHFQALPGHESTMQGNNGQFLIAPCYHASTILVIHFITTPINTPVSTASLLKFITLIPLAHIQGVALVQQGSFVHRRVGFSSSFTVFEACC
jgi:hypothetical protein